MWVFISPLPDLRPLSIYFFCTVKFFKPCLDKSIMSHYYINDVSYLFLGSLGLSSVRTFCTRNSTGNVPLLPKDSPGTVPQPLISSGTFDLVVHGSRPSHRYSSTFAILHSLFGHRPLLRHLHLSPV